MLVVKEVTAATAMTRVATDETVGFMVGILSMEFCKGIRSSYGTRVAIYGLDSSDWSRL